MTEEQLNSYRLTSLEEPTDEMLSCIMREAAEEATSRWEKARKAYFDELNRMAQQAIAAAGL